MEIKRYEGNGRLSLVSEYNGVLYLTGRTCMPAGDDVKAQIRGILEIIEDTLHKYGSDKRHILFAQVFLKDGIKDFDALNEVWEAWVEPGYEPSRATVQAKMAKEEALAEIVITAAKCE